MVEFCKIGQVDESLLKFAVISARSHGQWIFVRHKHRNTWEIPGGHREEGESISETAGRELFEETGAVKYDIKPICDYSVARDQVQSFGRLFYAEVIELGDLPEFEIADVRLFDVLPDKLTYPDIQPHLYNRTISFLE